MITFYDFWSYNILKRKFKIKSYLIGWFITMLTVILMPSTIIIGVLAYEYKYRYANLINEYSIGAVVLSFFAITMYAALKYSYNLLEIELLDKSMRITWSKTVWFVEKKQRNIEYSEIEGFRYNDVGHWWDWLTIRLGPYDRIVIYTLGWRNEELIALSESLENLEWEQNES